MPHKDLNSQDDYSSSLKRIEASVNARILGEERVAGIQEKFAQKLEKTRESLELKATNNKIEAAKRAADETLQAELSAINKRASKEKLTTEETQALREAAVARCIANCEKVDEEYAEKRKEQEKAVAAKRAEYENQLNLIIEQNLSNQYKTASIYQRKEIQKQREDFNKQKQSKLQAEFDRNSATMALLEKEREAAETTSERKAELNVELLKLSTRNLEINTEISASKAEQIEAAKEQENLEYTILKAKEKQVQAGNYSASKLYDEITKNIEEKKQEIEKIQIEIAANKELKLDTSELEDKLSSLESKLGQNSELVAMQNALKEESHQEQLRQIQLKSARDAAKDKSKEWELEQARKQKEAEIQKEYEKTDAGKAEKREKDQQKLTDALKKLSDDVSKAIDNSIDSFYQYQASIDARLQGSDNDYIKSLNQVSKNVGLSGVVSQKQVVENIKTLVESGVAYNLDLRAFLATVSEDIAQTFDAFDSNLLKLIRVQQSDTTAARLGLESSLNRLFNEYFSDTSYLSDLFDSVSQSIYEANSQLTKDASIEFEYMVQKWLGSLYSLGFSDSTISTIAQGLNYLGTGDVDSLNGNESLQRLLAMSAATAGIDYGDILTGGLDAETTNALMKSMIEYLKSIAENTDNTQVTKSAYSNVFGFNMSDLTAIQNLSTNDIENIYSQNLNYQDAMKETEDQLGQILSRTHISQLASQLIENATTMAAIEIGEFLPTYGLWKILNTVEPLIGDAEAAGFSLSLIASAAKLGIAGTSLMGSLVSSLGAFGSGSKPGLTLDEWDYDEYTSRGSSVRGIRKGTASGVSESSSMNYLMTSSVEDIKTTALTDLAEEQDSYSSIMGQDESGSEEITQKLYDAVADSSTSVLSEAIATNSLLRGHTFKTELNGMSSITSLLDPSRVFLTSLIGSMSGNSSSFTTSYQSAKTISKRSLTGVSSEQVSSLNTYNQSTDGVYNLTADVVNVTSLNASVTSSSSEFKSDSTSSTTGVITKLESVLSTVDLNTLNSLVATTSSYNSKTMKEETSVSGLKVSLNDVSPDVKSYLESTIKSMVASAMTEGMITDTSEDGSSFIDILTNLLSNLSVRVNNDFFDETLQKAALSS